MSDLLSQEEMEDLGLEAEQVNFVWFPTYVAYFYLSINELQFICVKRFHLNFRLMFLRSVLMGLRMKREPYQQKM